ncbi:hypothetical protein D4764_09G0004870 [Takifugu flavidus]|uniref:Uncharacterized protein n=1 Tax=Takifugu flavidus TaxID=433684 RepID=A0A5C6MLG5_9TELE|nr:hypothetical protein D4764_09G0004870 [Takifugu flavidus]
MSTLHTDLSQTIGESLGLKDRDDDSLGSLADMIQKETEEIVTLSITEEYTENTYIIQPERLNAIVNVTIELFRKFGDKIKAGGLRFKDWYQKRHEDGELLASGVVEGEPLDSQEDICLPQYVSPESVQEVIKKDWSDISSTLLEDITVGEYKKLQSESSVEIQSVLDEITTVLSEKRKKPFQALKKKVKSFFSTGFLRVWLCRLLANVRKKHPQDTTEESYEMVESIIDSLTPEFVNATDEEVENENGVVAIFQHTSRHNILGLTRGLTDLIYQNVVQDIPEPERATSTFRRYNLYSDIWKQSKLCISMMKWFMKARTKILCDRLNLHRLEPETCPIISDLPEQGILPMPSTTSIVGHTEKPFTGSTEPEEIGCKGVSKVGTAGEATSKKGTGVNLVVETQLKKTYISSFIDMVVFHICNEAGVIVEGKHKFSSKIFEGVWVKVQEEKMYITQSSFKNLKGKIHKCICQQVGSLDLLYLMATLDPIIIELITSLIRERLMTPPKKETFLSAVVKFPCKKMGN